MGGGRYFDGGIPAAEQDVTRGLAKASAAGQSPRPSIQGAIEATASVSQHIEEKAALVAKLAERAQELAERLGGVYPVPGRDEPDARESSARPAESAVDALNFGIRDLHPRIGRLGPALSRLAQALEAIDRAVG